MWTCPQCGDQIDDQFAVCRKCGEQPEVVLAALVERPADAHLTPPIREATGMAPAKPSGSFTRRGTWLLLLLFLPLAMFAGIGIGYVLPRISIVSTTSPVAEKSHPAGVQVEELKSVEKILQFLHHRAVVLKYTGGDVEFRAELEKGGQTEVLFCSPFGGMGARQNESIEGYFILVCDKSDDEKNREYWNMFASRDSETLSETSLKAHASQPLAESNVSASTRVGTYGGVSAKESRVVTWDIETTKHKPGTAKRLSQKP